MPRPVVHLPVFRLIFFSTNRVSEFSFIRLFIDYPPSGNRWSHSTLFTPCACYKPGDVLPTWYMFGQASSASTWLLLKILHLFISNFSSNYVSQPIICVTLWWMSSLRFISWRCHIQLVRQSKYRSKSSLTSSLDDLSNIWVVGGHPACYHLT